MKFSYKKENNSRKYPVNLSKKDKFLFSKEFQKEFKEIESISYENVVIFANGSCERDGLMYEMFYDFPKKLHWKSKLKLYLKTLIVKVKVRKIIELENALFITDHFSNGFFHWFGDVYQKLEALNVQGWDIHRYTIVIPKVCNHSYVESSLKVYGYKYIVIEEDMRILAKNMLYIPQISPTGNYRLSLMSLMRDRFKIFYNVENQYKKVFITRNKAPKRKIVNEDKLYPILKQYNFEIVAMEDLSFAEQYKMVAEADVLVSLHGAGLTHMLWMESNSKVLEIRAKDDDHNNCYFSLASDMNLKYYYVLAEKKDKETSTQLTDFIVDVDMFEKTIDLMMKESK